jgi:NADH-quinone oxidoreductase subunit E
MLCGGSGRSVGFCMDRALADNGIEGRRSRQAVDRILERFQPVRADHLLPLLQQIQDEYGHLPAEVLKYVSERTGIPTSRMYGVITFYALFHLEKRGRHTVRACRGTACHVRGGKGVIQAAQNYLGLADGETGENFMFSFETAACLGACALSPVVVADGVYSGKVTPERVEQILRSIEAAESAG